MNQNRIMMLQAKIAALEALEAEVAAVKDQVYRVDPAPILAPEVDVIGVLEEMIETNPMTRAETTTLRIVIDKLRDARVAAKIIGYFPRTALSDEEKRSIPVELYASARRILADFGEGE